MSAAAEQERQRRGVDTKEQVAVQDLREAAERARAELRLRAEAIEQAGEMVSIPGGTFRMGDLSGEGWDEEKPVQGVRISAFKLGNMKSR